MVVDLWTDIVCPWCYIGVARFERALAETGLEPAIRVHPFQLDPEAPVPGIPALDRYRAKFGDEADGIVARVTEEAAREGLPFDLERAISANTFDAHRAIAYAARFAKARDVERNLYTAYFADGVDVSDRNVLADALASTGIERTSALSWLESDDGVAELSEELSNAFERGVSAVPTFVFEEEFAIPGAVDTPTFVRILEQMNAMGAVR